MSFKREFLTLEALDAPEGAVLARFLKVVPVAPDDEDARLKDGAKNRVLKGMPEPVREIMRAAEVMQNKASERVIMVATAICTKPEELAEVVKKAKDAFDEILALERTGVHVYQSSSWFA